MSNVGCPTTHTAVRTYWGFALIFSFSSPWAAASIAVLCLQLGCKLLGKAVSLLCASTAPSTVRIQGSLTLLSYQ